VRSLHVVSSDARRGAETFAVDLADGLRAAGHEAAVVALRASDRAATHPVRVLGRSRRSLTTLGALRPAAASVDVVVAHGSSTLEACAVALAGSGIPFVYRTIGDPSYWVTAPWRRRAIAAMLRRAARNVVLWPGAAAEVTRLYGFPRGRVDVIPNAVPKERFPRKDDEYRARARRRLELPERATCLGIVGALSHEKQVAAAIRALRSMPETHLVVAGDGPERPFLERLALDVAPGRVKFLGSVEDPRDVYAAADLLVLPSRSEGMPAVIIEAGLVGTATVASGVGAIPEMVDDDITGFLIPTASPGALATRVQEALPRAREVGMQARATFLSRYTIDDVVPAWTTTLEKVRRR